MPSISQAIQKLRPGSEAVVYDNDYSTVVWHTLEGEAPTQSEIDVAIEQIKADEITAEATQATAKAALLAQLGITEEQAKLLLS